MRPDPHGIRTGSRKGTHHQRSRAGAAEGRAESGARGGQAVCHRRRDLEGVPEQNGHCGVHPYNSHSLCLAEHRAPSPEYPDGEIRVHVAERMEHRVNIADTDLGRELSERIEDLQALLAAYRAGETM